MFFKLLSLGTLIFGLQLSAEKPAGPDCIFGENAQDLMGGEVSGINLVSHRYVLAGAKPGVRFPEEASLVQTSTLSAVEKNQILAAINHQTQRSFKSIKAAIRDTDDAFVSLLLLKHSPLPAPDILLFLSACPAAHHSCLVNNPIA
jgi:hypothetical protein